MRKANNERRGEWVGRAVDVRNKDYGSFSHLPADNRRAMDARSIRRRVPRPQSGAPAQR